MLVLGDQLDENSAAFADFDPAQDVVWMAEVAEESTHIWTHQARIAIFLAAMRHFRDALKTRGWRVDYRELPPADDTDRNRVVTLADALKASLTKLLRNRVVTLADALKASLTKLLPRKLVVVEPGEWRVQEQLQQTAKAAGIPLEIRTDTHFLCTREEFAAHAQGRKQLRMEFFYREMRRKHGVLMEGGEPVGGAWNFDHDNRESFGKDGPGLLPKPVAFALDATTRAVLELVARRFAKHPGSLAAFDWPVTRAQALAALEDFIANRLPEFGRWQDAMWTREPWLYHSRSSAALNLKLLHPREVIAAAEEAYRRKRAPLASVEGFIRQILGWREYVRGIYYWTGETEMACLRDAIGQTLRLGYAHHIQRLMVTGLFALLLGVRPRAVHEWYLAVYVDAVEWVELPNTLGMSQFTDGGLMASKPYVATGKYIQRMSNYCDGCRFDPAKSTGDDACPFTTLYWDFLLRHERTLAKNQRMTMQLKNLTRLDATQRKAIQEQAGRVRAVNFKAAWSGSTIPGRPRGRAPSAVRGA